MAGQKTVIMDADGIRRALTRIAFEIIEKNKGAEHLLLAGIRTRGIYLAQRIAQKLGEVEGTTPPVIDLLRPRKPHPARRSGRPRPPRAPHPPGLYRQKPADLARGKGLRPPPRGGRGR